MHRRTTTFLTATLLLFAMAACADIPDSEPADPPRRPTQAPRAAKQAGYQRRFEPVGCPFDTGDEPVECGYLLVPENRAKPDGAQVRLAVSIIRSSAADPRPDPL